MRVPKTTFRLKNALKSLLDLCEICFAHSYGLLQKRKDIKISPREKLMGQGLGKSHVWSFRLSFSRGVTVRDNFPSNKVQQCVWNIASQWGSPEHSCPESLLRLHHMDVVDRSCSWPSGGWTDTTWPKTLTINHFLRPSGMGQGPRQTKIFLSGQTFPGLWITSQELRTETGLFSGQV